MSAEQKTVVVSASKLIKFSECPFRYKNEPRQDPGDMAKIGSAVHDVLANTIKALSPTGLKAIPDDAEYFLIDIAKSVAEALVGCNLTNDHYQEVMDLSLAGIEYFNRCVSMKSVLAIESDDSLHRKYGKNMFLVTLPVKMRNAAGEIVKVQIEGANDLVSNRGDLDGIEVTDWKTGFNEENRIQADTYAVVSHLMYFRQTPVIVNFPFLRTESVSHYEYNSLADIEVAMNFVESLVHKFINDTHFDRVYGNHCKNCTLAADCPTFNNNAWQSIEADKLTPSELVAKYKEFLAAEKVFKDQKKVPYDKLLEMMGKQDVRSLSTDSGNLVRFKSNRGYEEDSDAILDIISQNGIPIGKCAVFSYKKTCELLGDMVKYGEMEKSESESLLREISRFRFPNKSETIKVVSSKNNKV